jgi:hypothetical protein
LAKSDDGLNTLWEWFKALFSKAPYALWSVASVASTLLTFIPLVPFKFSELVRPALITFAIASFGRANFKLFQSKQTQIDDLEGDLRLQEAKIRTLEGELAKRNQRVSQLMIHPGGGSRYILRPLNSTRHADFNGGYFEFRLRVENTGARNSVVAKYRIEILELEQDFPNLLPEEGQTRVQGRHCQFGMDPRTGLSETKIIQIGPESSTKEGALAFFIPGLNLETFTRSGLTMHGEQRQFGVLHCRLTITDSSGVAVTADFELSEA